MTKAILYPQGNIYVWVGGIAISFLCVTLYILQVNAITSLAFHIAESESQIRDLKNGYKRAETAMIGTNPHALSSIAHEFGFEKIEKTTYVKASPGGVAQNRQ